MVEVGIFVCGVVVGLLINLVLVVCVVDRYVKRGLSVPERYFARPDWLKK